MPINIPAGGGGAGFDPFEQWYITGYPRAQPVCATQKLLGSDSVLVVDGLNNNGKRFNRTDSPGIFVAGSGGGALPFTMTPNSGVAITATETEWFVLSNGITTGQFARTPDGVNWTVATVNVFGSAATGSHVAYHPPTGNIIASFNQTPFGFISVDDGVTWNPVADIDTGGGGISSAILPNGRWILSRAVGGTLAYSDDGGLTWTAPSVPPTTDAQGIVEYHPGVGRLAFITLNAETFYSTDGDVWIASPPNPLFINNVNAAPTTPATPVNSAYSPQANALFAASRTQYVMRSDDAINWRIVPILTSTTTASPSNGITSIITKMAFRGNEGLGQGAGNTSILANVLGMTSVPQ